MSESRSMLLILGFGSTVGIFNTHTCPFATGIRRSTETQRRLNKHQWDAGKCSLWPRWKTPARKKPEETKHNSLWRKSSGQCRSSVPAGSWIDGKLCRLSGRPTNVGQGGVWVPLDKKIVFVRNQTILSGPVLTVFLWSSVKKLTNSSCTCLSYRGWGYVNIWM